MNFNTFFSYLCVEITKIKLHSNHKIKCQQGKSHIVNFFILQVKIQGQNQEMLYAACQQFLGKSQEEVRSVALETLVRF